MEDLIILKIKELLAANNVSIQDFAKGINRSRQNIYDIFGKRQTMTLSFLIEVASFFKIPVTDLLTESKERILELENEISKLSEDNRLKDEVILFLTHKHDDLVKDLEFIYSQDVEQKTALPGTVIEPGEKYLSVPSENKFIKERIDNSILNNIEVITYLYNKGYLKKGKSAKDAKNPNAPRRPVILYDYIKNQGFVKEENGIMRVNEG